ncbi:MAG: hypothetical protein DCC65_12740 [Planctomycetota bacterium]|nr:MAG: hypothetical protein DCC65_12740 [Planctomycetota bacterium]
MAPGFEFFDHTADLGIRVFALDRWALVPAAVEALYAAIGELVPGRDGEAAGFTFVGTAAASLLRDFMAELLVAFETRAIMLTDVSVRVFEDDRLEVGGSFRPVDHDRSVLLREVKAITYHELSLEKTGAGWEARIIIDI